VSSGGGGEATAGGLPDSAARSGHEADRSVAWQGTMKEEQGITRIAAGKISTDHRQQQVLIGQKQRLMIMIVDGELQHACGRRPRDLYLSSYEAIDSNTVERYTL
jgi:hypothetical protein